MLKFGHVEGFVERASLSEVVGWCWLPDLPAIPLLVQLQLNGEVISEALSCCYRKDLQAANKRDGACMFVFSNFDIQARNETRKPDIEVYVIKPVRVKLQRIVSSEL